MGIKDKMVRGDLEDFVMGEKRHRELILTIKSIVKEMPKTEINFSSLESVKESLNLLIKTQSALPETDNKSELMQSIRDLSANFVESMIELKAVVAESNKPKEYVFHVERNNEDNRISKVIAKTK